MVHAIIPARAPCTGWKPPYFIEEGRPIIANEILNIDEDNAPAIFDNGR